MATTITADDLDLSEYLKTPAEALKVRPASDWQDDVIASFGPAYEQSGCVLPWEKTHSKIRLRPGDLSIWAGVNGHGKSILLNQACLGLCAQDEKVCIASLEMKPVQTLRRATRQFVGVENPTDKYIRDFHAWTDGKLWLYDQVGTVKTDIMLAVVRYCIEEIGITHFVIDSLMKCGLQTDNGYDRQKNFIDELSTLAKDKNAHIHVVAHSRKRDNEHGAMDKFDVKGAGEITDMADNVFTLSRNKKKEAEARKEFQDKDIMEKPDAYLNCDKQRNGDWEGPITLWFDTASTQYLPYEKCPRMNDEDWSLGRWV